MTDICIYVKIIGGGKRSGDCFLIARQSSRSSGRRGPDQVGKRQVRADVSPAEACET